MLEKSIKMGCVRSSGFVFFKAFLLKSYSGLVKQGTGDLKKLTFLNKS